MQLEFFDIPSPCIGICQSNDKGQCLGCFRTRDERVAWTSYHSDEKQKVIKRCQQRKKRQLNPVKVKVTPPVDDNKQASLLEPAKSTLINTETDLDFGDFEL